jgi:glutathione S-transferase
MKLFDNPASPFCRKVHVLAIEAGLIDQIEIAPAVGSPVNSEQMPTDHNPLSKIPTLVLDDGMALFDSSVICRYLDDQTGNKYCPAGDYKTMRDESLANGIMEAAVAMVYEFRARPEGERSPAMVEALWGKVSRGLDFIEADTISDGFDLSHIALAAALGYIDFRHDDRNWRGSRPKLAKWFAKVSERDSLKQTNPNA